MMRFEDPVYLLFLLLIIPLIYYSRRSGGRIRYSSLSTLKKIQRKGQFHPRSFLSLLRILTVVLFVLALARPQSGRKFSEVSSEGVDILLALDTSGSMRALDFKINDQPVNRLDMVKKVVLNFIQKRPTDRIGLIVFGEEAFTQCPLTLDHGILADFLTKIDIGMAGDATAIGQAIGTGVNRMKDLKSKDKIMILLTDGVNTAGRISPIKAAELAQTLGIKIYTIGVGTRGKAPYEVDTFFGKRFVYQDVEIDEKTLTEVSMKTGGKYYRATDVSELEQIYDEIDKLEKTEISVKQYTEYNELFHLILIPGLVFLFLEILLGQTKLRKIP